MRPACLSLLVIVLLFSACEPMRSSGREAGDPPNAETPAPEETSEANEQTAREAERVAAPSMPKAQKPDARYDVTRAADVDDQGIFSDLDSKVSLTFPAWTRDQTVTIAHHPTTNQLFTYVDGVAVGFGSPDMGELKTLDNPSGNDDDADGIPNQLDILIGAKKTAINAASYNGGYQGMDYPGGDVPRTEGVCTDVVIRAVRNAGIDLQKELHEDIERAPAAYPMVDTPDTNIDQRRVKTLLPYFERQWIARSTELNPKTDWLPGDIVFMNTMRDERPDHLGIVSDQLGPSGYPLIINNWTNGYQTQAMDLLGFVPVTHRFRLPVDAPRFANPSPLASALVGHGLRLDETRRQAVLVLAESHGADASLTRYERDGRGHWRSVGEPQDARVGRSGLGLGRGLETPIRTGLSPKVEGDGRAPAGVFSLGTAFGRGEKAYNGTWPWKVAGKEARWVDDPNSADYNTWQEAGGDWSSAETLANYGVALVVEHNMPNPEHGAGSAIFVHDWSLQAGGTLGCTGVSRRTMLQLLAWLDEDANPVLVQLPRGDQN